MAGTQTHWGPTSRSAFYIGLSPAILLSVDHACHCSQEIVLERSCVGKFSGCYLSKSTRSFRSTAGKLLMMPADFRHATRLASSVRHVDNQLAFRGPEICGVDAEEDAGERDLTPRAANNCFR